RLAAARALAEIGPDSAPALPALVDALRQSDAGVRLPLFRAVGSLGPKGGPAVPVLVRLGGDADPAVRREAAVALERVGGKGGDARRTGQAGRPAVGKLTEIVRTEGDWLVRMNAVRALGQLGAEARQAVPA